TAAARALMAFRYGAAGARPKAYLHASLHADETPPMLVAHHLAVLFDEAAKEGRIAGEIVLVPVANPLGLDQNVAGTHVGRYELAGGGNFNRGFPDLTEVVATRLIGALARDEAANDRAVRDALAEAVASVEPQGSLAHMRHALMRLAVDADIVLDLHCDAESLPHLHIAAANWPAGADLAADLGSRAQLVSVDPGGSAFEDTMSGHWRKLRERFGAAHPIPQGCFASTVELRGRADVDDGLARADAEGLLRFLMRRGVVRGEPGPLPAPVGDGVPFEAVDMPRTPVAGIVAYRHGLGDAVAKDEVIADVVDPMAEDPRMARTPVATRTEGFILARRDDKLVRPGQVIAKVVGREVLPGRTGLLLED
ncbi:MAG: succinylglutamate desuccinylase/aspartoacylase family protein, partial [Alphaproteobacteria bacterium]